MAKAALELNELDKVETILSNLIMTDIREGEVSMTDLWFAMCEKRLSEEENIPIDEQLKGRVRNQSQPPENIDFRVS